MSSFKYKPPKKIELDERTITTLDSKHKELQTEFQYIQDIIIPGLENEKKLLKERLAVLKGGCPPPGDGRGVPPPGDGSSALHGGNVAVKINRRSSLTGGAGGGAVGGAACPSSRRPAASLSP